MSGFGEWLLSIFRDILQYFIDLPLQAASWLWEALLKLLSAGKILGIVQNLTQATSQIPASVWYFMDMCQVSYGITAIFTAYVIRFVIRRIPVIG